MGAGPGGTVRTMTSVSRRGLKADDFRARQAGGLAKAEVAVDEEAGVPDARDVALLVEVEVRAANREENVGDPAVVERRVQRVDRSRGLIQVRSGCVDLRILQVPPAPREGEREHLAGVPMPGQRDARRETRADHPQGILD